LDRLAMDSPLLSPAKARQAAIQAKDWAYVNSWLNRQYSPNPVPNFERNEDTLRTLLALAAANDAADEEAALLHRAREEAIREFREREEAGDKQKKELLDELELCLGENGKRDLDDLAETTAVLGALRTGTKDLGQSIIELTVEEFDAQEELSKVDMLQKHLEKELAALQEQLDQLKSDPAFEVPADLPAQTAEWSRSTKMLTAKLTEYQDRLANLGRDSSKGPTIEDLGTEEKQISQVKGIIQILDHRLKMFHDLPKDVQGARAQYRQLERELNQLIERRDSMFESLVEKR
jgi:HAUS augmin-like complex subunit 1